MDLAQKHDLLLVTIRILYLSVLIQWQGEKAHRDYVERLCCTSQPFSSHQGEELTATYIRNYTWQFGSIIKFKINHMQQSVTFKYCCKEK